MFDAHDWILNFLDRMLGAILASLAWLVIPIALLLFMQWPLRDVIQSYSREANDLGQWIYALLMASAVTAATRARTHISTDALARSYSTAWRQRLNRLSVLVGVLPWAVFVVYAGGKAALISAEQGERFADTNNPFYFVIKLAAIGLAILMVIQAVIDLSRREAK